MKPQYTTIKPGLSPNELQEFVAFLQRVRREGAKRPASQLPELVRGFREEIREEISGLTSDEMLESAFTRSVLLDLIGTGWRIRVVKGTVQIAPARENSDEMHDLKSAVRRSHQLEREDQLREASVREFIKGIERRRLTPKGWHSIFSLMRDGRDLAPVLKGVLELDDRSQQVERLGDLIDPYVQLVTKNEVCEHTGLALQDIWRYFRHTWVNSYKTLPGRTMCFLVRDAAAANHPVIGIAALGSSVSQQRLRDVWIGWDQETMVETIREKPSAKYGRWLLESIQNLIEGLYINDLLVDGICTREELEKPSDIVIAKLKEKGELAIKEHRRYPHAAAHKKGSRPGEADVNWDVKAQTSLFRSKRCKTLAKLLQMRCVFQQNGFITGSKYELKEAMEKAPMRNAIGQLVRLIKAQHVGIDMMDLIVCGAVAPYNTLLGGKLICMLLCSPEIVAMYRERYGKQESVIASSMKGAAVVRSPQLVFLGTTSLYGVGSSQYNRVKIPCDRVGGRAGNQVVYKKLGKSEGYGSYHFGELTGSLGDMIIARQKDGRRVNSIFGEGVNPRMRKLREAFDIVNLPSDKILQHRNVRVVYGVALAQNFSKILLGLASVPQYLIPKSAPTKRTQQLAQFWRERWLLGRIGRPGILDEVARHTLVYPITHGGRVNLPRLTDSQAEFEELE